MFGTMDILNGAVPVTSHKRATSIGTLPTLGETLSMACWFVQPDQSILDRSCHI